MARTPFIAANWKMHKSIAEAIAFVESFKPIVPDLHGVEIVLCPPFTALAPLKTEIAGSQVKLGAQNLFWEEQGAYTGEISPVMLRELCTFVIVGHSERRAHFHETDEIVNRKLAACFEHRLHPILCVGESLEQREAGETEAFVSGQIKAALQGVSADDLSTMVIAYEPIWAIGTGRAATPGDAAAVINDTIRKTLTDEIGEREAEAMRILYGGSVKPDNAASYFNIEGIDGALVGGASLEASSFSEIIRAAL